MADVKEIAVDDILRVVEKQEVEKVSASCKLSAIDCASMDLVKVTKITEKSILVIAQDGKEYEYPIDEKGAVAMLELTGATKEFPPEARTEETRS